MTTLARPTAPLRADCIADTAGGLTFDVTVDARGGAAHLVLRRREGHQEVFLPLTPGTGGRLRAALPSSVLLPEGCWDAYARVADDEWRLMPGVMDLRAADGRVPYETRHGNLSLRCGPAG
ncbi:hypothetical protein DI272_38885 [Streptomyces sp. Act143]|uniref:hypothetical protein n=1 Tax=Streptomyces sp. Act143 TaxID=2200760 RepID=UPI000D68468B|nr:hypothetical protein [Streptomyces sp. Act143]PWI19462.1 hypothetical protein DI272_38885 [Streptomyces sp. Act143]